MQSSPVMTTQLQKTGMCPHGLPPAAGQQITPVKAKKEIKRNGDIRTLKSLISFDIK